MISDEQQRVLNAIKRWLSVAGKEGYWGETGLVHFQQLCADIDHSALLRRLIEGKQPLPIPPPRAIGYPWYDIIERGHATVFEVLVREADNYILIEQMRWNLFEKRGDRSFIVTYDKLQQEKFHLYFSDELQTWMLVRMLQWH